MSADGWVSASRRTPLADEVRGHGPEDGQATSGAPERELEAEEAGCGPGVRHADPQGGSPPTRLRAGGQLTCPERRRRTVESVRRSLGHGKVSERRVCRVLDQNRGTQRNRPGKVDGDRKLLGVMRKIVEAFPRHGSERTHQDLRENLTVWGNRP